jgi:hypothetical protein
VGGKLALANELVCADLTGLLEATVEAHGQGELLIDGERYRYHAALTGHPANISRAPVIALTSPCH